MTTPNSTTEAGVTDAEVLAAYQSLSVVLHIDHTDTAKFIAIRRALEAFAQSRQPSAQGGDAIARSKRILALVDDYHDKPTSDTRAALRHALMDEFATPPATSGMKEADPVCYVDAEFYRDMLRPDFGSATGVAVSKKSNGEDVALYATPPSAALATPNQAQADPTDVSDDELAAATKAYNVYDEGEQPMAMHAALTTFLQLRRATRATGAAEGAEPTDAERWRILPLGQVTAAPQEGVSVPPGYALVPLEPSDEHLTSMAIRSDHGLGVPGYYDQPMMRLVAGGEGLTHAKRLEGVKRNMRQLYEEAIGQGFFRLVAPQPPASALPLAAGVEPDWKAVAQTLAPLAQHAKDCLSFNAMPDGMGYWHCSCGLSSLVLDGELLDAATPPLSPPATGDVGAKSLDLPTLFELGKVYANVCASPHHMTFSVESLRSLIESLALPPGRGMVPMTEGEAVQCVAQVLPVISSGNEELWHIQHKHAVSIVRGVERFHGIKEGS